MQVRLVALVPVLGLILTGCTGGGASVSPDRTLEPLPSPTATALEVPPSAQATTPQGAAAFARYYLQVVTQAFNSNTTTQLRALSHPECGTCKNLAELTEKEAAKGRVYEGGAFLVDSAEATERAPGDAIVDVVYRRAPSTTRDGKGAVVDRDPGAEPALMQMRTLRSGDGWVVRAIRFPEKPS